MTTPEASLPLVARAVAHADRIAMTAPEGTFRYRDLLDTSAAVAARLLAGAEDLCAARVAFLTPPRLPSWATLWRTPAPPWWSPTLGWRTGCAPSPRGTACGSC